jgi:hypothetical protein
LIKIYKTYILPILEYSCELCHILWVDCCIRVNIKDASSRLARWSLLLQDCDLTIEHRAGQTHQNADSLSSLPPLIKIYKTYILPILEYSCELCHILWVDCCIRDSQKLECLELEAAIIVTVQPIYYNAELFSVFLQVYWEIQIL